MSTFIGQLIGFAVIVYIVWRYVVPPVRKMMTNQQETVRKQLADSAEAKEQLAKAEKAHEKAIEAAKAQAKQVTEEANADAKRLVEQLHAQADAEVERIKVQGAQQVQLLRAQLIRQLRQDLGGESVRRAERFGQRTRLGCRCAVGHRRPIHRRTRRDGTVRSSGRRPGDGAAARGEPGVAGDAGRQVRPGDRRPWTPTSCPRWPMIWRRSPACWRVSRS